MQVPVLVFLSSMVLISLGCSRSQPAGETSGLHAVEPVRRATEPANAARGANGNEKPPELGIGQTPYFSYALPGGWSIGEQGAYALTMIAPDKKAITFMVGGAGFPVNYPPAQYAHEKLMAIRPENLQLGPARRARPLAGFAQAYEFDVTYAVGGVPCRGVAKVNVYPAYDTALIVMTAALSAADQWAGYAPWLPQVGEQISATNGGAFGQRGVMAQNLKNSTEFAEAARSYREASARTWQQVVDDRNASEDRKNSAVRENLGGVQTYSNPYGTAPVEMPMTYQYYWTNRQGKMQGTNDPGVDPNSGSTYEWRRMTRVQP